MSLSNETNCSDLSCAPHVVTQALSNTYNARMAARLGFSRAPPPKELSVGLLRLMYQDGADFTNAFRALSSVPSQPAGEAGSQPAESAWCSAHDEYIANSTEGPCTCESKHLCATMASLRCALHVADPC
jgi:uncharacterized protein YdiU (UPF0061 family)